METYPDEVIVPFEAHAYGVLTPRHGLWDVRYPQVPLKHTHTDTDTDTDTHTHTGEVATEGAELSLKTAVAPFRRHTGPRPNLELVELPVLPEVQLQLLLDSDTHPQLGLSRARLGSRRSKDHEDY